MGACACPSRVSVSRLCAVPQETTPDFVRAFAGILQRHNLLPDDWRDYPELALGTAKLSEFYLVRAGRRVLGLAWISEIVPGHSCNLNLIIEPQYRKYMRPRGQHRPKIGTGTLDKMEFFVSFFERCFDGLGVRRITLMVPEERKAAKRMAVSAGFVREGTLNDGVSYGGKSQDVAVYGLTRRMWQGV